MPAASGITGAEAAAQILQRAGIPAHIVQTQEDLRFADSRSRSTTGLSVQIIPQEGVLGDHYDPSNRRLVLSRENFYGTSVAALGIAAHECGHAIQHKIAYAPLQWRMASVNITGVASQIVMILPIAGFFMGMAMGPLLWILAIAWGILMVFQLITLPVEFDASRRAKAILGGMGFIRDGEEADGVRKTLDAAGWTYVAAFVTTLAYFLWHLLPLLNSGSNEE